MGRRRRQRDNHPTIARGDQLRLRAESAAYGGGCIARLESGEVVFVHGTIPGELVDAEVTKARKDYLEATATAIHEPSADRIEPPCPLFGRCGGCQYQHIPYPKQLELKRDIVREQLRRIGHIEIDVVEPVVGAADPWVYRNHVRLSTGRQRGEAGYIPAGGRGLLRVDHCPIADPWVNDLLPRLQGKCGGLHQVQLRHNAATGSYLVQPRIEDLGVETGQDAYVEELAGRRFRVSDASFFQVNTAQAEHLVRLVREALPARGLLAIDAFAGVGTFAALIADRFDRVLAIEEAPSAVRDAEDNLRDLPNIEMVRGKVEQVLPGLDLVPDAVILDPPRAGCARPVLDAIAGFAPATIAYVSCDPSTLARDLRILIDTGFALERVTPVDMFPQTAHIECVAVLRRAGR